MRLFDPLWIALSTYSILPAPRAEWDGRGMRYALCCLPVVGLVLGGALLLWHWACKTIGLDSVLFASVAAALPLCLTGGIHMDGFMDTVDALSSHQPREQKLAILKDPRCGAFAVMFCCAYVLAGFGLCHALYLGAAMPVVCMGFVFSRALAVLSAATLPNARKSGLLFTFTARLERRVLLICMILTALVCAAGMLLVDVPCGAVACAATLLCFFLYRRVALKQFGGATGDTTGFFIQICELSVLAGAFIGGLL